MAPCKNLCVLKAHEIINVKQPPLFMTPICPITCGVLTRPMAYTFNQMETLTNQDQTISSATMLDLI